MSGYNGDVGMYPRDDWNLSYPQTDVDVGDGNRVVNNEEDSWALAHISNDNGSTLFDSGQGSSPEDLNRASTAFEPLVNIPMLNVAPPIVQSRSHEQPGQYCHAYPSSQRGVGEYNCPPAASPWHFHDQQTNLTNDTSLIPNAPDHNNGSTPWQQVELTNAEQRRVPIVSQINETWASSQNTPYGMSDYEVVLPAAEENDPYGFASYIEGADPQAPGGMDEQHHNLDTRSGSSFDLPSYPSARPSLPSNDAHCEPDLPIDQYRGPWSPENPRQDEGQTSLYMETNGLVHRIGVPNSSQPNLLSYDSMSSMPLNEDPETSATSLSLELDDNMIGSCDTILPGGALSENQSPSIDQLGGIHALAQPNMGAHVWSRFDTGIRFQFREGTPVVPEDDPGVPPAGNTDLLLVPRHSRSNSESSSPSSVASPWMPDVLQCNQCGSEFSGRHRKGNLARHRRLKHRGENEKIYLCEDDGCAREFKRQDARLKHYRRHHKYLVTGPMIIRGPQRPRLAGNSQSFSAEVQEPQDQVLRNVSGWTEGRSVGDRVG